ncbi:hypothetical protein CDL15_Pgr000469 [Punica granatum]|uniref:Uncharacterized protein n=1 Tax=Punica granatum TaxID=22663 RepID=A0A218W2F5_PUNGR|nr:hypothetical protein CDL15_Pgr000469 [Punica granatum]PKI44588.1 hypothetical protein CRG98_034943 [Punica granatum]
MTIDLSIKPWLDHQAEDTIRMDNTTVLHPHPSYPSHNLAIIRDLRMYLFRLSSKPSVVKLGTQRCRVQQTGSPFRNTSASALELWRR